MPPSLPQFLKSRAERNFSYLLREVGATTAEEARRFASNDWVPHKWGIGQNGSIAGIVYHVAAWKSLSLSLFEPVPLLRVAEDFDPATAPAMDDWEGVVMWLREVGTQWNEALGALPESEFDRPCPWEESPIPIWEVAVEFIEHDVQHAAQIEYLRQRLLVENLP